MGRIRTIKPEFPQSESMGRVSRDARLTFILLWTLCDDHGRARGDSRLLANLLYPYDTDVYQEIDGWLNELEREHCIQRYTVDGQKYIAILNWHKHQRIDHPGMPKYPAPPETPENQLENDRETLEKVLEPSRGTPKRTSKRAKIAQTDPNVPENSISNTLENQLENIREDSRESRENSRWIKDQGSRIKDQGSRTKDLIASKAKIVSVEVIEADKQSGPSLLKDVMKTFEEGHGTHFANYPKEVLAAKWIIKQCNGDEERIKLVMKAYWELIHSNDRFWSAKPFSPSMLRAMWDHIIAKLRAEVGPSPGSEDILI